MSLAEYKKRQQKLKSKPERRAPSTAAAKPRVPVSLKNLVNSPPPVTVKQSVKSGTILK